MKDAKTNIAEGAAGELGGGEFVRATGSWVSRWFWRRRKVPVRVETKWSVFLLV
ncbi:hypothetical protein L195_g023135 [Trifolium pratense]|uniref:Uncharacterized protein n=1 Tax=Trifolium pratense TaxID=57577 RepID=A0A2K3NA25_TRIPR|nr:hypothetical protein L195_g023135 [Trifolium pratense]